MQNLDHSPTPAIKEQEPTRDGLKTVLEDLPLIRIPNMLRDERCNRCERKNEVRRRHNLPQRDETFADGERVYMVVGWNPDPDECRGWEVRAVFHMDHPMLSKEEAGRPNTITALVSGTLEETGWTYELTLGDEDESYVDDRSVVRDVEIEWYSPEGHGEDPAPVNEADKNGIADPKPTDGYSDWPDEENEWRREILRELGNGDEDIPEVRSKKVLDPVDGVRDPKPEAENGPDPV